MDYFYANTTFHGICYLNEKNKRIKLIWSIVFLISTIVIIYGTSMFLYEYFQYNSYVIENEEYINSINKLPYMVICESDKVNLRNSIINAYPNLSQLFDQYYNTTQFMNYINNYQYYSGLNEMSNQTRLDNKILQGTSKIQSNRLITKCFLLHLFGDIDCIGYQTHYFTLYGSCIVIDLNKSLNKSTLMIKSNKLSYHSST